MTPDAVTDELVRIAAIIAPHEREIELNTLKRDSGIGMGALRDSLRLIARAQQEAATQERIDPMLTQLRDQGWFMLLDGGKVWAARFKDAALNGHSVRKLECLSVPDFVTWVHHLDPEASVEESPGRVFVKSPSMPRYDGTTIDPAADLNANGKLNLWRGFAVTPEPDAEAVEVFYKHVLRVCGDEAGAKYMMDWIAWGFQNPGSRIGTAIVLIGAPGTGKGMIGNLLAAIWGSHGLALRDKRSIVGDFNAHLTECAFAFVDEALFSGDKQTADKIKGLITEPTLMTEAKFKSRAETTNMLKMIMASNHEHAIQVDPQDRRFTVFRVPDDMPGSRDPYWKEFYRVCHSVRGRAGILSHMLHRDIHDFNPEADRPVTEGYLAQKLSSLEDDFQYWKMVAQQGTLNPGERIDDLNGSGDWPTDERPGEVRKDRLYRFYCRWHQNTQRFGKPVIDKWFFRNARAMGVIEGDNRYREEGAPVRYVTLASFDNMREAIDGYLLTGRPGAVSDDAGTETDDIE